MNRDELMSLPRTLREARAEQLEKYFTDKPCIHGHKAARSTRTGHCLECYPEDVNLSYKDPKNYATRAEAMVQWRKDHPDYHRNYNYRPENAWRIYLANFKWRYSDRLKGWTAEDFERIYDLWTLRKELKAQTGEWYEVHQSKGPDCPLLSTDFNVTKGRVRGRSK